LQYILKSLEGLGALQPKSENPSQQSVVASQLIGYIKDILAATPEHLLESSLCEDTITKIQQLDRHRMTSRILYHISVLARLVNAHKSLAAPDVHALPVPAIPSLPISSVVKSRNESPSPRSVPRQTPEASPLPASPPGEEPSRPPESPQIRQPLGELHTEPTTGTPHARPERKRGTPRDSRRTQPKSLRNSAKKVMCRICEEEYPQSVLKEHIKFCVKAANADLKDQRCDARLVNMLKLLEEHRQNIHPQGSMKDTYRKVVTLSATICSLQYGKNLEKGQHDCFAMLDTLQTTLANEVTYDDIGLITYLKRIILITEEKWNNMGAFARLRTDQKKHVNMWSVLSLLRPHMQTAPSSEPDELLFHNSTRVSIKDFELIKRISSGAYGKVYLARKKKSGDLFAIKIQSKSELLRKNMVDNVIAERQILTNVKTPFVVKLYYAFESEKDLFLVMEYCPGGDVSTLLHNLGAFDMDMARVYAAETVLSLESLHKMSYVHRDLKPDNLLVNAKGHLLLTDFGLSKIGALEEQQSVSSTQAPTKRSSGSSKAPSRTEKTDGNAQTDGKPRIVGTPDYLAPEMLLGTGHGPEVDWWALGIMIYEFLTGIPPFNAETPEDIFDRILRQDLIWPEDMDPEARSIISQLLNPDASKRLGHNGADEVKAHPFFAGINWDTLLQENREDIFVPQLDNPEDTSYHEDHRQSKGSSMESLPAISGQEFKGFAYTNTYSLSERTQSLANEDGDDDDDDDDDDEEEEEDEEEVEEEEEERKEGKDDEKVAEVPDEIRSSSEFNPVLTDPKDEKKIIK